MLTEFGKVLRKIRIDKQILLKNMADALKVSSAYLSAVENGKRRIPQDWVEKISEEYTLDGEQKAELSKAADNSMLDVKISLDEELTKIMSSMKKAQKRGGGKRA